MSLLKKFFLGSIFLLICSSVFAEEFVINKIRVTGLQHISRETLLNNLPVKEGDLIDSSKTTHIIRELYKTNFFSNVSLKRQNNDLLIEVIERAIIGSIKVNGNNKITNKQLSEVFKTVGLTEGQILDQALLSGITQALIEQYHNLGLYDAKVIFRTKKLERNRVAVIIDINEGPTAKIRSIKIIGNKIVSEKALLEVISLSPTRFWSFFTQSDRYSREKLDADLEKLRSYYMDRGYIDVKVEDTKVTITPDKKHIYIVIRISEGVPYKFKGFSLDGNLIGKRAEMLKLITIKSGAVFSRKKLIEIQSDIAQFLGDYGYAMPDIKVDPIIDNDQRQIFIKFIVNTGRRIYVRRINFSGNTKTHDEVLRRAMRQHEGSLFSLAKVNESRRQLANLGYLQDVDYKVVPIPNNPDQIDLTYNMKEVSAITASIQGGYSDADGLLYGANLNDQNIFGTGKTASIKFENSRATQTYSLGYVDPYFTNNNISLSVDGFYQKNDLHKLSEISVYSTDTYGASAELGIPLSDYNQLSLGLSAERIKIKINKETRDDVLKFIDKFGSLYRQLKLSIGWNYANFDRAIFPTNGFSQAINLQVSGPLDDHSLYFYKTTYKASWYQPLFGDFIFHARADAGYGNGLGRPDRLPFFENFFAGGINSVHGFEAGTLGFKDKFSHATGGNILTTASASIILPAPLPLKDSVRPSLFVDIGNVYNNRFNFNDLRSSYGIQVEWRTPLLPIIFSLARPIHQHKDKNHPEQNDHLRTFQFTIAFST